MGSSSGGGSSPSNNTNRSQNRNRNNFNNDGGGGDNNMTNTPKAPPKPTTYVDSGTGEKAKKPTVAADGQATAQSFIGGAPQASQDASVTKFIAGAGEGGADDLTAVLGAEGGEQFFGQSPFQRMGAGRGEGFLGQEFKSTDADVGLDATVEAQENAPAVGGGEPGVGLQGFGSRALIGGEGEIITAEGTGSNAVNTDMPAEQIPSDIQQDANYQIPGPGKAAINDYNFSMPFLRNPNVVAFLRNSRGAAQRARGPVSRGLMSARSGFGKNLG